MINLFHIPNYIIDTSRFKNLLSDQIVQEFEREFANFVGAKYAVSLHSATAGIFLAMHGEDGTEVAIPSLIPPVVANALNQANCYVKFEDNVDWVGHDYVLHKWSNCKFIDSAQRVSKNQFASEADPDDLMLFSFFPTKPVGSCDGGMIVSNNQDAIEQIRILANNGMKGTGPSWEREQVSAGYKLYMNSISAWIANENLKRLPKKYSHLGFVQEVYNMAFELKNTSYHLYRIAVKDNTEFVKKAHAAGIQCGIHYRALHTLPIFKDQEEWILPKSGIHSATMVSLPFHEKLTHDEIKTVIDFVNRNR